jgi:hypothetical protein
MANVRDYTHVALWSPSDPSEKPLPHNVHVRFIDPLRPNPCVAYPPNCRGAYKLTCVAARFRIPFQIG